MNQTQRLAQSYVDRNAFANIEWAVKHKGDLVDTGIVGHADASQETPVPEHAIYRIYSMTKPIVSLAALMLVERGQLQLYDPVAQYIGSFATQKIMHKDGSLIENPVLTNLEHLLTHRAGLSYDFLPDCPVATLYRNASLVENGSRTLKELAETLGELPAAFIPGTQWQYSYATDVLARCMEVACGQPLDQILRDLLLDPLGMSETDFHVKPENADRLMPMFGAQSLSEIMTPPAGDQMLKPTDVEPSYPSTPNQHFRRGGLGLYSTTRDYLRFAECLRTGKTSDGKRLVSTPMFNMMWTNRIPQSQMPLGIGPNVYSGYGWNLFGRVMLDVGQAMSLTGVGEGGWAGAAATYFWVDRAEEMTGVVMTQYLGSVLPMSGDMRAAAYSMLDVYGNTD